MLIKTTIVKIIGSLVSFGSLSVYAYITKDPSTVIFYINFLAILTLCIVISDVGLSAINSNVSLSYSEFYFSTLLRPYTYIYFQYFSILTSAVLICYLLDIKKYYIFFIFFIMLFRVSLLRWVSIMRKSSNVLYAILLGEIGVNLINALCLIALYYSKSLMILSMFFLHMVLFAGLLKDPLLKKILFPKLSTQTLTVEIGSIWSILHGILSSARNSILGIALGTQSKFTNELFMINRLGVIYLLLSSGVTNLMPSRLRSGARLLQVDLFTIILLGAPVVWVYLVVLETETLQNLIQLLFDMQLGETDKGILLFFSAPIVLAPVHIFFVASGRLSISVVLDFLTILLFVIFFSSNKL